MTPDEIADLKRCLSHTDGQSPDETAAFGAMASQLITEQEMRIEALAEALKYARRFVRPKDCDVQYIDAVLRGEVIKDVGE